MGHTSELRVLIGSGDWGKPQGGALSALALSAESGARVLARQSLGGLLSWLLPDGERVLAADEENGRLFELGGLAGADSGHSDELSLIGERAAGGHPVYLASVSRGDRRFLIAAHYQEGRVTCFPLQEEGHGAQEVKTQEPGAPQAGAPRVASRPVLGAACSSLQVGKQAHSVVPDPAERFLHVSCKGSDQLVPLLLDDAGQLRPGGEPVQRPGGPRHLVFHPELPVAYGTNELAVSVTHYDYDAATGRLTAAQTHQALCAQLAAEHARLGDDSPHTGADLHLSPDGRYLLTSQRSQGRCTVAAWRVDPGSGRLTLTDRVSTGGTTPRHFCSVPTEQAPTGAHRFVVGNQDSPSLALVDLDIVAGQLRRHGPFPLVEKPFFVAVVG